MFNLSKYLEIVKLKLIITFSISIHVLDILPSRVKFKASLVELGRFYLTGVGMQMKGEVTSNEYQNGRPLGKYLQTYFGNIYVPFVAINVC